MQQFIHGKVDWPNGLVQYEYCTIQYCTSSSTLELYICVINRKTAISEGVSLPNERIIYIVNILNI